MVTTTTEAPTVVIPVDPSRLSRSRSQGARLKRIEVCWATAVGRVDRLGLMRRSVASIAKVAGWGLRGAAAHAMHNPREACQRSLLST